ncbi:hypothetical protein PIB30_085408 [Stylosanthes scabra]|uniref:Uncharacterized protein n=1 Tax=Stylosanthes scabra TaxID=79078 RepID=A0ABU6TSA6_9FABA|nr:hypothetical protein [Stylosanthes scabra]
MADATKPLTSEASDWFHQCALLHCHCSIHKACNLSLPPLCDATIIGAIVDVQIRGFPVLKNGEGKLEEQERKKLEHSGQSPHA